MKLSFASLARVFLLFSALTGLLFCLQFFSPHPYFKLPNFFILAPIISTVSLIAFNWKKIQFRAIIHSVTELGISFLFSPLLLASIAIFTFLSGSFSVSQHHFETHPPKNITVYKALTEEEKTNTHAYEGYYESTVNNFGTLLVTLKTPMQSNFIFRLKEKDSTEWLFETEFTPTQEKTMILGFPKLKSKQKTYTYQILPNSGELLLEAVYYRHIFSIADFRNDPTEFLNFLYKKAVYESEYIFNKLEQYIAVIFISFGPFLSSATLLAIRLQKRIRLNFFSAEKSGSQTREHRFIVLSLYTTLFAAILRLLNISLLPFSGDEGLYPLITDAILKNGFPLFESGQLYMRGYLFSYLTALSGLLLGTNHFSMRLVSLLTGVAFVYFLTQFYKNTNKVFACGVGIYAATYPYLIAWSTQARHYMIGYLLLFLSLAIFHQTSIQKISKSKLATYIGIVFVAGSSLLFSYAVIPAFLVFLVLRDRWKWLRNVSLLSLLASFTAGYLFNFKILNFYRLHFLKGTYAVQSSNTVGVLDSFLPTFHYYSSTILYSHLGILIFIVVLTLYFLLKRRTLDIKIPEKITLIGIFSLLNFLFGFLLFNRFAVKYLLGTYIAFGIFAIWILFSLVQKLSISKKLLPFVFIGTLLIGILSSRTVKDYASHYYFERNRVGDIELYSSSTISQAKLYTKLLENPHVFHGITAVIRSPRSLEALSFISNHKRPNDIYVVTDIYNPWHYGQYDYIMNGTLSSEMGYIPSGSNKVLSIYSNTPYIRNADELTQVLTQMKSGQTLWLFAGRRFSEHNNTLSLYVMDIFTKRFVSPIDEVGVHSGRRNEPIVVYSYTKK